MGNSGLAKKYLYEVMHERCRMESFNTFMEDKFEISPEAPDRIRGLGYDLDVVTQKDNVIVIDIGGGQGELFLELKKPYLHLKKEALILKEFNADTNYPANITAIELNFKGLDPQSIRGADVYNLMHIFHNMPDAD